MTSAAAIHSHQGSALFERGYRPFFLGAAVVAAVALPLWLGAVGLGWSLPVYPSALDWHIHEMVFGYVGAVIAGFLLTAIPNWTGRLPVAGRPLALLFALWLAGRTAMLVSAYAPVITAVIDAAFLCALAAVAWREVLAGGNRRNLPVCLLVSALALANIGFHAATLGGWDRGVAERIALSAIAALIALIGGRIVPSFTRNWAAKRGAPRLPAQFGLFDTLALGGGGLALLAWIFSPGSPVTAALFALGSVLLLVRLARWRGFVTGAEPLLMILHVGYLWLPVWFGLMALQIAWPLMLNPSAALHALTAGAIGTMTVAVMTRATLGHSGRDLTADALTVVVYFFIIVGALIRVLVPFLPADPITLLTIGGLIWSTGFALFVIGYAPIFLRHRS